MGNSWVVTVDAVGKVTYGSNEYFHVQIYNHNNSNTTLDYYMRSTDTQIFYYQTSLGYEVLVFQTGPVGTQWNYPVGGGYYWYYKITSIGSVTVPDGTYATTYGVSYCRGNSGPGGSFPAACTGPTSIQYWTQGPGSIKVVDNSAVNNPPNTEVCISRSSRLIYAGFAGYGISAWDSYTWSLINDTLPTSMVASGSKLYAIFAGYGLYAWDGYTWSRINDTIPASMVASGSKLYAIFTGYGIYAWDGSTWTRINDTVPASMMGSDTTLYATFPPYGIYAWDGSTWTRINETVPASMVAHHDN